MIVRVEAQRSVAHRATLFRGVEVIEPDDGGAEVEGAFAGDAPVGRELVVASVAGDQHACVGEHFDVFAHGCGCDAYPAGEFGGRERGVFFQEFIENPPPRMMGDDGDDFMNRDSRSAH